jgi:dolichyl-phosphate beta-glucosyltransferase
MSDAPHLSIVIPAYNEAKRLPATVEAVVNAMGTWPFTTELVLVDDGSSDTTPNLIAAWAAADPHIVPVTYQPNRGKGAAVVTGVAATRGRYVVFFDADLSYPLDAVPRALDLLTTHDLCIGARDLDKGGGRAAYSPTRKLTSVAFNIFVRTFLWLGVRDTQCGFKSFRGDVARKLFPRLAVMGYGFDVELLYVARRWKLSIALLPIKMIGREGSSVSVIRHSLQMARDVMRIRFRGWFGKYPRSTP